MLEKIKELGILPVIKIDDENDAVPLAAALIKGDLPAAEITFRTKAAKGAIKKISNEYPDMILGAGTVLTTSQVDDAIGAGASFIISPGFNPKVVRYCIDNKISIFPGINNPSGIEQAIEMGLDTVKFFPAEASGGLPMLKAMAAPYGNISFMPTGGIGENNIESYLAFDKIVACGGSWMVPPQAVASKDFDLITTLTKSAVTKVLGLSFKHVGLNSSDANEAGMAVEMLKMLFGCTVTADIAAGTFIDGRIEVLKNLGSGAHGHLAFQVNNMQRALAYFARKGVKPLMETAVNNGDKMSLVYLDCNILGFSVHLSLA